MSIRLEQLISLPELKVLRQIAGSKGNSNTVRWVHVIETPDIVNFVQNDELIFLTGVGINDNEQSFYDLIKGLIVKKASGMIVNIGKYIKRTPNNIIKLAEENNFPLFEALWEVNLASLTRVICENIVKNQLEEVSNQDLLMNIIFFNKISYEDFYSRISSYGYKNLNSYRVLIVDIDGFHKYLGDNQIKNEQYINFMKDTFIRTVSNTVSTLNSRPLIFLQNDSAVVLLLNEKEKPISIPVLAAGIKENVKSGFQGISVSIGVGNVYSEFSKIRRSYIEAEKALKVLKAELCTDTVKLYSDLGIFKILTEVENANILKEYYDETVGRLKIFDEQNNSDYTNIFHAFLLENGNYIQTAQKLYLHRNTLMYKINKIQDIIKRDLSDMQVRFEFYLGYLISRIISN